MNTKKAIKILKKNGHSVEYCKETDTYVVNYQEFCGFEYSARELIKFARYYTSENHQNTAMKSKLKYFDHRKDRNATKAKLKHGLYDDIPLQGKVKTENCFNWD